MDETMALTVIAILLKKGLKTSTMLNYICALRESHIAKDYSIKVFEKNNLDGKINIDLIKRLKANLQRHPSSMEDRRMTWCTTTWLFSESERPIELLGTRSETQFGVQKALRWEDLTIKTELN